MKAVSSGKHGKEHELPTLAELGHDTTDVLEEKFPGGEQEALRRLDEHMQKTVHILFFWYK